MIEILRQLWWMLKSPEGRLDIQFTIIRDAPGQFGMLLRERLLRPHFAEVGPRLSIFQGVRIRNIHKISLGDNVFIGDDVFLQAGGGMSIGDNTLVGPGSKIWTQNHRFDHIDIPICDQGATYAKVIIGEDCWIGSNAFIMPGVELPRGCIVAAHTVVGDKKYRDFSILMGNPARVIGYRDKRNQQKSEGPDFQMPPKEPEKL